MCSHLLLAPCWLSFSGSLTGCLSSPFMDASIVAPSTWKKVLEDLLSRSLKLSPIFSALDVSAVKKCCVLLIINFLNIVMYLLFDWLAQLFNLTDSVCLGSTKYIYFCLLCLKRHISERYGWESFTIQIWASISRYSQSYGHKHNPSISPYFAGNTYILQNQHQLCIERVV